MPALLPLAAIEDWLKLLVPLVFFVIWAINQLIVAARAQPGDARPAPPRRKPENPRPKPAQPPRPPVEAQFSGQEQLNAEIDEFLKRAGQRRTEQRRPTPPPVKPPLREKSDELGDAEPVALRDEVARSVEQHLGNRGFTQRAEHLADDVVRSEQQLEDHVQKAFSHKLGTFAGGESQPAAVVTDANPSTVAERSALAAAVANALSNRQSLREIIVLKEILERPTDRW